MVIIIITIIVLLFYFILQNNIKITIITILNVHGAFILAETCRKTSVLLFVDNSFLNDSDEFGNMFVARIALAHAFKKTNTNFTEQMLSNSDLAQIFLALWTLKPGAASLCSAV